MCIMSAFSDDLYINLSVFFDSIAVVLSAFSEKDGAKVGIYLQVCK